MFSRVHLTTTIIVMIAALCISSYVSAQPGADINNGTIRLGVAKDGSLIITPTVVPIMSSGGNNRVGVRYMPTNADGSAFGALVDGWGVADTISGNFGVGVNGGSLNLTGISQTSTATSAVSTVTAGGIFLVTHDFHPSTNANAYEITVTIRNISAATVNGRYRRTIDWDIEPTETFEYVTIQGSTLSGILSFTDDALTTPQNPLIAASGINGDVINRGPGDLGASITFDLGPMAPGAIVTFNHYYGASNNRANALAAVTALGMQGYSLSSPNSSPATVGTPNTFFYGFFGTFIGVPPAPPPPPPPNNGPRDEGSYPASHGNGGVEGTFGFGAQLRAALDARRVESGGRLQLPMLLGPYRDGSAARVFNVSQRQRIAEESTTPDAPNQDTMWDFIIFAGLCLGLMFLVALVWGVPVVREAFQRRLF